MSKSGATKIEPGLKGSYERVVLKEWALSYYNPDWPEVFSTPAMIGMMEVACSLAVRPFLPPGSITVGVRIEVDHIKAVPVGVTVLASSKLAKIDGRRLIFDVEARCGDDVIGRGHIYHTIVEHARFAAKAGKKP